MTDDELRAAADLLVRLRATTDFHAIPLDGLVAMSALADAWMAEHPAAGADTPERAVLRRLVEAYVRGESAAAMGRIVADAQRVLGEKN